MAEKTTARSSATGYLQRPVSTTPTMLIEGEVWQRKDDAFTRHGVYSSGETFDSVALSLTVTIPDLFA